MNAAGLPNGLRVGELVQIEYADHNKGYRGRYFLCVEEGRLLTVGHASQDEISRGSLGVANELMMDPLDEIESVYRAVVVKHDSQKQNPVSHGHNQAERPHRD